MWSLLQRTEKWIKENMQPQQEGIYHAADSVDGGAELSTSCNISCQRFLVSKNPKASGAKPHVKFLVSLRSKQAFFKKKEKKMQTNCIQQLRREVKQKQLFFKSHNSNIEVDTGSVSPTTLTISREMNLLYFPQKSKFFIRIIATLLQYVSCYKNQVFCNKKSSLWRLKWAFLTTLPDDSHQCLF